MTKKRITVKIAQIIERKSKSASPNSFGIGNLGELEINACEIHQFSLHHFDFEKRLIGFIKFSDQTKIDAHPFFYLTQFHYAEKLILVSFNDIEELPLIQNAKPILIFSAGRSGSTLAGKLTEFVGIPTISEPDTFSNLAKASGFINAVPELARKLLKLCFANIEAMYEGEAVYAVKFRGYVTPIIQKIVDATQPCKIIYLIRRADDWAISTMRALVRQILSGLRICFSIFPRLSRISLKTGVFST